MATRKTTAFYAVLIAVASIAVGMVIASRLDLAPRSEAQSMAMPPANSAPLTGPIDASTFRNIAERVSPSVVNIQTESRSRAPEMTEFFGGDEFFRRFFGDPRQGPEEGDRIAVAAGTGFIINDSGMILTNSHVVDEADRVWVSLYGDESDIRYEAKVIGSDPLTDSALIELVEKPSEKLPAVSFGDSSLVLPGDWVMAIGNPFNLSHTVSVGVVSALKRPFPVTETGGRFLDMLQTDAAINPGNSGGPLLNVRGEVVGMNTAIYAESRRSGNIGIGFAVPINMVRNLLPQLSTGKITRGMIGVSVRDVPRDALEEFGLTDRKGALVATVGETGPAGKAGMRPGDVIVEVNGRPVPTRDELVQLVMALKPGTTVPVKVMRDKQEQVLNVTVGELNLAEEGRQTRGEPAGVGETAGFGMTLGNLTAERARRLGVPANVSGALVLGVDRTGPAGRSGLTEGDVILRVNRQPVESAAEASRALQEVRSGGTALILIWRENQEIFLTVKKD